MSSRAPLMPLPVVGGKASVLFNRRKRNEAWFTGEIVSISFINGAEAAPPTLADIEVMEISFSDGDKVKLLDIPAELAA